MAKAAYRENRKSWAMPLAAVLALGAVMAFLSWNLPFNEGPDEAMRYKIAQYVYNHGTMPHGADPEVVDPVWGFSYAFHPILMYWLGGWLMRLVSLFTVEEHALLMAARAVNVLAGMGFYWFVLNIGRRLFAGVWRIVFYALLIGLPQLMYLFIYVNNDGIAMFSTAVILYFWIVGMEDGWTKKTCAGLSAGLAICALSYYNAYGYMLMSVPFFILTFLLQHREKGRVKLMFIRGGMICGITFLLCGWWFIRSFILYDGDIFGLWIGNTYAEVLAAEEFRPSVKQSVMEQGISLKDMLLGGWIRDVYYSFVGYFGAFKLPLGGDIYVLFKRIVVIGALGTVYNFLAGCRFRVSQLVRHYWGTTSAKKQTIFHACLICCMIIPVVLSVYYSYASDYQAQGRYIMPMVIPMMIYVAAGLKGLSGRALKEPFVQEAAIVVIFELFRIWYSGFVNVFLPGYVSEFGFLAGWQLPWLIVDLI